MLSGRQLQRDAHPPPLAACRMSKVTFGHDSNCRRARHQIKILVNCFSVLTPLKLLESVGEKCLLKRTLGME